MKRLCREEHLLAEVRAKVQENISIAQVRQKADFESKQKRTVKCFNVKEGDEVLLATNKKAIRELDEVMLDKTFYGSQAQHAICHRPPGVLLFY